MHMVMLVRGVVTWLTLRVIVCTVIQKIRINVELGIQVETLQIEHLRQGHFPEMHHFLGRTRIHVLEAVLQSIQVLGGNQVGLADEDLVGKTHLTTRLLAVIELLGCVFGVNQGQDRIEQKSLCNLIVHEKGLRYRPRIGQTGGLDHDAVKTEQPLATLGSQQLQGGSQILANGATNTPIAHLNDLLVRVRHQDVVVDVLFTKLVLDHGDLLAVGLGQHTLEQGGFARTQKTGQDGGGDEGHERLR